MPCRACSGGPVEEQGHMTVNDPLVVEEVRARFEEYEQALVDNDVELLDGAFWRSPHTIRLARDEHGYGFDEIHEHRMSRPPGPNSKESRIRLDICTLGRDFATVNLVYKILGH